ncbi:Tc toxin subunit A-related protein [Paraliomyxa miuraensis]|uniref:Tc toxin subunit A-related protein n=1 Tax=Paraliomyxa miuraensis TaxID=376150 RepID=UPI0022596B84|nr:neuraminidase-like domain-containing protein [Paraliomyxa miuraensis]MCX4239611.1 neuraminidase-like domain-containing protein [Paraliomyxa miuraensis]
MANDPASLFTIEGTVYDPVGARRPGVRLVAVDVVDDQQSQPKVLVSATTDASGRFSLPLSADQALRLFRSGKDEEPGEAGRPLASRTRRLAIVAYVNTAVVGRLDLPVTLDGMAKGYDVKINTTQSGSTTAVFRGDHQVSGVLHDAAGQPVAGIRIEVLHRRLRDEVVITSTHSGSDGSFRLSYDPLPLLGEEAKTLAIVVRALEQGENGWEELVRSERFCPAPRTLELTLTLPGEPDTRTEIEKVGPVVAARTEGLTWGELTDDDAEFIACQTGLPLSQVALYVRAARLAESTGVPVEAIYALGARGMTVSVAAIGALRPAALRSELLAAAEQQLVPAWADIDVVVTQMSSTVGARAAADDDDAPLGQLLAAGGLPTTLRESFVVGYVGRTGTVAEFWQDFASTHAPAEVDQVRFTLYAGTLANDHLPLVTALESRRQAGDLSSPRDLAALGLSDWQAIVSGTGGEPGTGAPATYPGADQNERESLYAIALARAAEEAFPTTALVQRVAKSGRWALASAYVAEHPTLDFRTTNARQYLRNNPPAGLTTEQEESLRQELSTAQRLFMVAPRFDRDQVAGALLDAGIHSAQQIAAMGPSAFVETHGGVLGEGIAKVVFDNAHHVSATLATLLMKHAPSHNSLPFPSGGGGKVPTSGDEVPPDLEGLLGPLDYCACSHCRSVLSPAAYLVDLLRFLEQRPALADEDGVLPALAPFDVLVARRPDLLHTLLDCANTNTPLPTIDLVNEILEREVVGGAPASWPQTTRSAQELRAQPEHRIDAAYDALRTAVYPWSLPFDLARVETEAFLGHLGVPRHELLQTCGAPSSALDDAVMQARLGLTQTAAQVVAGQDVGQSLHALWGMDLAQWPASSWDVRTFLERTQLDFEELQALAFTTHASGGQFAVTFATPCQLDGATVDGLDDTRLGRIHRFLRLQRALGWTMAETDAVISALGSEEPDPLDWTCLHAIARFIALHERLGSSLPRAELLAWFGDLSVVAPASGARSQYEDIYVEPTAQGETGPLALGQPALPLTSVMPRLAAALSRTEDEVARLLALDPARTDTTIANLSWLYRWSSLARALELSIDELVALVELSGVVPFTTLGAGALETVEDLVQIADRVAASGVSVLDLDALLRHQGPNPAGISEPEIAALLVELVRGLQAVRSELSAAVDPSRSALAVLAEQLERLYSPTELALLLDRVQVVPTLPPGAYESVPVAFEQWLDQSTWELLQNVPAGLEDPLGSLDHRASLVLGPLVPHLRERLMEGVVVRKLGEAFALSAGATRMLLALDDESGSPRLSCFVDPSSTFVDAIDFTSGAELLAEPSFPEQLATAQTTCCGAVRWLAKAAALVGQLRFGDDDLRWLLEHAQAHGVLSPAALVIEPEPDASELLEPWLALQRFAAFARQHTDGIPSLRAAIDAAGPDFRAALAKATGWEDDALPDIDSSIVEVADRRGIDLLAAPTVDVLWQLGDAFTLARRLGVTAARACAWATPTATTETARDVQAAAKARVPAQRWPAVIEPLRDRLRVRQRDALVAYVLANDPTTKTPEDLFGRLLIDTQVSPCAKTSRIKQALSAVQTFVQRVQLHLEPGVNLSASASGQWQWMSRYRVWEANRKIFLWPENWLEPELRDDKTELFTAFENTLLERELSEASAEAAVTEYVQQLDRIAQLHVAGIYHEREVGPGDTLVVDRLHVFARTKAKPYQYFYRMRVDDAYWTPWESVPLRIEATSVIPSVFRRRLMLMWPTFERKVPETDSVPNAEVPLRKHYEIRMSWCVREEGRWGEVKVSDHTASDQKIFYPAYGPAKVNLKAASSDRFFFRTYLAEQGGVLVVAPSFTTLASNNDVAVYPYVAHAPRFYLGGSRDDLGTSTLPAGQRYEPGSPLAPKNTDLRLRGFVAKGDEPFDLEVPARSQLTGDIVSVALFRAPFRFTVATSQQYPGFASQSPFVFQDRVRSFFVVPRDSGLGNDLTGAPSDDDAPSLEGLSKISHGAVLPALGAPSGSLLDAEAGAAWSSAGAHGQLHGSVPATKGGGLSNFESWSFELSAFSHPFADRLLSLIRRHGVEGIYEPPETGDGAGMARQLVRHNWNALYEPKPAISSGSIVDELEFEFGGAYSVYNWELFFHVPMYVALRLCEDRKFAEAQRWMHFVFNPTEGGTTPTPSRYWKVKPLFEAERSDVAEQLESLHYEGDDAAKNKLCTETRDEIAQWRKNPFRPHALARLRHSAYQRWVLMRYLDNLVQWGDHLFRQDTIESNNEALQLYVLAAQLLGPRPTVLPAQEAQAMTYANVQGSIDEFSNFLAQAENAIPTAGWTDKGGAKSTKLAVTGFDITPPQGAVKVSVEELDLPNTSIVGLLQLIGTRYVAPTTPEDPTPRLYFCVPHNDAFLRYWDLVEDRLFKLRHCLNIEGVARQLPLFDPPIDPGLLARAAASGVDLSTALSDVGAMLPHYRFSTMLGLAKELAAEVRGFGSAVADALRNADAEELAELRAAQEAKLLATLRQVREQRIGEAQEAVRSIERAIDVAQHRKDHYDQLLKNEDLPKETNQLSKLELAKAQTQNATALEKIASTLMIIPAFSFGFSGNGVHSTLAFGTEQFAGLFRYGAMVAHSNAGQSQASANISGIQAGYERRKQDWELQRDQANKEIVRLEQDLVGAQLRVAIAKRELSDHDAQLANAKAVDAYLRERYTNAELYRWLGSELSRSYFQGYQLAFEIAKQAQRCYRHELGIGDASFIEFGYWDNRRKGLLAGERLLHDLRRMETSYLANNRREYELTKKVSLSRLDPFALLQLRQDGSCYLNVPEALFELDHPSHYMRRLRSVRLSVIGNTGPFDSLPATLTLTRSQVRTSATSYADPEQPVVEAGGATQSIALSTGLSDAGLFEANLRDERYLPFEGKGAVSDWRIDLPKELRSFDYGAISDVVLELQYTAREGGAAFASQVLGAGGAALRGRLDTMGLGSEDYGDGRMWAWSVRSRFPEAWASFVEPEEGQPHRAELSLASEHYPHPLSGSTLRIKDVFVVLAGGSVDGGTGITVTAPGGSQQGGMLNPHLALTGVLVAGPIVVSTPPAGTADAFGSWAFEIDAGDVGAPTTLEDLIVVVRYTEGD